MIYASNRKLARTAKFFKRLLTVFMAVTLMLSGGLLGPLPIRAEGITYTWTGNAETSDWHTPGNWNVGESEAEQVPGNGDTVIIEADKNVTYSEGITSVTLQCAGNLTVSGGTLSLVGESSLTGGTIGGDGTIEISGSGSKLTWSGGTIGRTPKDLDDPGDLGKLIVGEGAEFLIENTGQAVLNLLVENRGRLSVSKTVTQVSMQKGYTQTDTGTLSLDISKDGEGSAVFGHMSIKQETALELAGKLHVNLVDGYMPAGGTTFKVLVYTYETTRSGAFDIITSSEISRSFTATHTYLDVTLTAQEVITAAPMPSLYPGTYGGGAISVALFSHTEGATIYYSTDGSHPTRDSTSYTDPIEVTVDTTIKAFAESEGLPDSPVVTLDYVIRNDFAGGYGTEENPYEVATADQLNNVRDYDDCYFKQIANIDLNDEDWLPIDHPLKENGYSLCVIFDGQGYTISNLFISQVTKAGKSPRTCTGLFGLLGGAEIRNVHLLNVDVTGDLFVGGLVGNASNSLFENCSATGQVRGTSCIGGLLGLIGYEDSYQDSQIRGSYSTCKVSGTDEVGGLVGESHGKISNSYAMGAVTATSEVGGLVGYNSGTIDSAYAMGE